MWIVARKLTAYDFAFLDALIAEAEHRIGQMAADSGEDFGSDEEMADDRGAVGFLRHVQRAGELIST